MNNYLKEMEKKNDFIIMMIKFGEEEFTWHQRWDLRQERGEVPPYKYVIFDLVCVNGK